YVKSVLDRYGLGSLADWARDQLIAGKSDVEILQMLRERPEFKERFKAITIREGTGLPAISPEEVLQYEKAAHALMREAGLPAGFYDDPDDFATLLGVNVSLSELAERINEGYLRIQNAPMEVKQAFEQFFGVNSSQAMAAMWLDPEKALPVLKRQLAQAEFAGAGAMFEFDISQFTADRAASTGIGLGEAMAGFSQLDRMRNLFRETVT